MATLESVQQKERDNNPFALKVLKVLRGLLLKKSPMQGLGQSPEVFPYHFYPVAGAAGNSSTANGCTQNLYNVKIDT